MGQKLSLISYISPQHKHLPSVKYADLEAVTTDNNNCRNQITEFVQTNNEAHAEKNGIGKTNKVNRKSQS